MQLSCTRLNQHTPTISNFFYTALNDFTTNISVLSGSISIYTQVSLITCSVSLIASALHLRALEQKLCILEMSPSDLIYREVRRSESTCLLTGMAARRILMNEYYSETCAGLVAKHYRKSSSHLRCYF